MISNICYPTLRCVCMHTYVWHTSLYLSQTLLHHVSTSSRIFHNIYIYFLYRWLMKSWLWKKLHRLSERVDSLGIMRDKMRAPLKPSILYRNAMFKEFQRASDVRFNPNQLKNGKNNLSSGSIKLQKDFTMCGQTTTTMFSQIDTLTNSFWLG